jgi:hypothetical protein
MNIVFLGAEVPSNRLILEQQSATHVGVSYWGLVRRGLPKTKTYLLENYFTEGVHIHVYPGIPSSKEMTADELEEFAADYEDFIATNLNRISLFTEINHPSASDEFIQAQRQGAWDDVPDEKFAAIYNGGNLESLATRYLNVCIQGDLIEKDPSLEAQMRKFSSQHGTQFHALGMAKLEGLRKSPFVTAATLAWLSPMMRGETIVWQANTLTRYPKRMKDQARSRYRAVYQQAGLDFDKILADDAIEVSKLAVWSYQQLEAWNNRTDIVTMSDDMLPPEKAETTPVDVTMRGVEKRKVVARKPDEIRPLPVIGIDFSRSIETDENGVDVLRDVPVARSTGNSLRQCNTCFVRDNCPAFVPDNACAFNLPLEVKTKDQLKALINTFLEIQGQRVAFAKFTEDLNGGYPDPNVGQEMDRFFKMLEQIAKMDQSKETIRMTVERSGSAGVMSALFGDRAQILNELPNGGLNESQVNEVIKQIDPPNS